MNSVILRTAVRFLLPLLLLFSVVVLLQGHNKPGGGFVGGLVAAAAFALHALAFDPRETRRTIPIDLRSLIGIGLLLALASALLPILAGRPFFTGLWVEVPFAGEVIHLGTPLLFDLGVYTLVVGVALLMVLTMLEAGEGGTA